MQLKKCAFILLVLCSSFCSFSLQAQLEVGGGAGLGLDLNEVGVQARAQLGLSDALRVAGSFSYFFVGDNVTSNAIDANLHYRFSSRGAIQPYVLTGIEFYRFRTNSNLPVNISSRQTGFNLGLGTNFAFGDDSKAFIEGKYSIDGTQLGAFAGVLFTL